MHTYLTEEHYKDPFEKFSKAYIDHSPDIEIIDLTEGDKWLILATDGMWNHLRRRDIPKLVSEVDKSKQEEIDS